MKKWIKEFLICPVCLPEENELVLDEKYTEGDDIIVGSLNCPVCKNSFQIKNGIAILDADFSKETNYNIQYETFQSISEYLWSHFYDSLNNNGKIAYKKFANLISGNHGHFLDVGCAVGRFSFEMSKKFSKVIGIDKSFKFIETARDILHNRLKEFEIIEEGELTSSIKFPHSNEKLDNVEFILADALRLPFKSDYFSGVSSLNILDKVLLPEGHINEMHRVLKNSNSEILISDPFSWSEKVTAKENWLGGKLTGKFSGRGIDNLEKILMDKNYKIEKKGAVWWKIRNHKNHFELIRSCYIKACK